MDHVDGGDVEDSAKKSVTFILRGNLTQGKSLNCVHLTTRVNATIQGEMRIIMDYLGSISVTFLESFFQI